ncbi:MAG: hypothetical protein ACR2FU_11525 [Streptosporangiaceae bacterium]
MAGLPPGASRDGGCPWTGGLHGLGAGGVCAMVVPCAVVMSAFSKSFHQARAASLATGAG